MFGIQDFRDLVSGRRRGIAATLLRGLLRAAEMPYALAMACRNRGYDRGWLRTHDVGVPVISVGNLTLGGTGKTPLVEWVARHLRDRGVRVAIVSRGYGTKPGAKNDEALELELALPDVPHVQNPDRIAASLRAAQEFGCQVVLLDDGFQHRRLARDLDIVLVDATAPFGFEHVFPRGELREPLSGLRRADVVCLSRANKASDEQREAIRRRVEALSPQAAYVELAYEVDGLVNAAGDKQSLSMLNGRKAAVFCGIGNPDAFRPRSGSDFEVVWWRAFPDHHNYSAQDVADIETAVKKYDADLSLCTRKDLVKLRSDQLGGRPLWALTVGVSVLTGQEALERALTRALPAGTG